MSGLGGLGDGGGWGGCGGGILGCLVNLSLVGSIVRDRRSMSSLDIYWLNICVYFIWVVVGLVLVALCLSPWCLVWRLVCLCSLSLVRGLGGLWRDEGLHQG